MRLLGVLCLGVLVFGGCGGTGGQGTSTYATTPSSQSALDPIRGLIVLGMSDETPGGAPGDPAAVVGDIVSRDGEVRSCGVVMDSSPPPCSLPGSVLLVGAELSDLTDVESESDVAWTTISVVAVGSWTTDGAVAVDRLVPVILGTPVAVTGVIEQAAGGRWVVCTAPGGACAVTAVPLVGYVGPSSGGEPVLIDAMWAEGGLAVEGVFPDGE